jgi:hypothetical protein
MAKSGPKTSQERATANAIIPGARIPAPDDLEPAAKVLWDAIVLRLPADWFTSENVPLLKIYVRHAVYADRFAKDITAQREIIAALEASARTKRHFALLALANGHLVALHRAHGFESDRMVAVATKLRLTNQSRYVKETAASKARSSIPSSLPPWHDWGSANNTEN